VELGHDLLQLFALGVCIADLGYCLGQIHGVVQRRYTALSSGCVYVSVERQQEGSHPLGYMM
jgi:hypothetical protein